MKISDLFNHIRVALGGHSLSEETLKVICGDLDELPRDIALSALGRCLIECRGTLFVCDVYERTDNPSRYIQRPYYEDKDFVEFVTNGREVS